MKGWQTWRGMPCAPPSLEEQRDSCRKNAEDAGQRVIDLGNVLQTLAPGDPRIRGSGDQVGILHQITAAKSDVAHWREYERYYRAKVNAQKPAEHWSDGPPPSDGEAPF